jgi:TusA-related sulfurtransferase|tara:strand:+ start:1221 stop:1478 length:258 start_codon:yes stop_codon:yes gene_type:complete
VSVPFQADEQLDTLGMFCPMPIIMTSKKFKQLEIGKVLEVLSDDEGIKQDMPAWCKTTGQEFIGLEEKEDGLRMIFKTFVRKIKA